MRIPISACRAPSAGGPAACASTLLLSGCAGGPAGFGAWGFVSLALLAAAAGAYALGLAHAAARIDTAHRRTRWQPPGGAAVDKVDGDIDIDIDRGNGNGNGNGNGIAADAERAEAAALPVLLAQLPGPALWAQATPAGWQVRHVNEAARALWPALGPGAALDALRAAVSDGLSGPLSGPPTDPLPEALRAALPERPDQPATAAAAGAWQLIPGPAQAVAQTATQAAARPALHTPHTLLLRQITSAPVAGAGFVESEQFSFTVSHDLRAPIRVVEGFTRIVKEDYGRLLDRVANDHLDRVLGAAARMNLMIDALLTLARLSTQPLARQPVNLSQLAAWVVDDLRRGAPEREAEIEIEPGLHAHGDPTLLRMVLENLLGNAWKYSSRCVRTQISLRSLPHAGGRALVVRDNGAGFDMRSAERLFGLFQRLHSASEFPGHGVGLASVRRIVGRHGGEVWAEAEAGRGAAFFFTLGA